MMKYLVFVLVFFCGYAYSSDYALTENVDLNPERYMGSLPNIEQYNIREIESLLSQYRVKGSAKVIRMVEAFQTVSLYQREALDDWGRLQGQFPKVILIESGVVDIEHLISSLPETAIERDDNAVLVKYPIVVAHGGTLVLKDVEDFRLAQETGSFLLSMGNLFVLDSQISAWSIDNDKPAYYSGNKKSFRPFITTFGGSESYFANSQFQSLGYQAIFSYGISVYTNNQSLIKGSRGAEKEALSRYAKAWLVNNEFIDMYFGFYCFHAKGLVVANNTYIDNIIYGIDPHDFSSELIIANNTVYGTKVKHGIIVSREVTDSYIFGNKSFKNNRSGIMLDRSSERNVIANNTLYENGGDGISIYESDNNKVVNNRVFRNKEHGIRARNSQDIQIEGNAVVANKLAGVFFHIRNLDDHTHRDLELDPYEKQVSGNLIDNVVMKNKSGGVYAADFNYIGIQSLNMSQNGGAPAAIGFIGDLQSLQTQISHAIYGAEPIGVRIDKNGVIK